MIQRKIKVIKEWTTKVGYKAVIIRHNSLGHLCGYVGISKEHPLYDKSYSSHIDVLIPLIEKAKNESIGKRGIIDIFCWDGQEANMGIAFNVHGGVTYSGASKDYPIKSDLHWIGFDTAHADDTPEKCNEEYVTKECESLAEQIKEVEKYKDNWFEYHPLYKKGKEMARKENLNIFRNWLENVGLNVTLEEWRELKQQLGEKSQ